MENSPSPERVLIVDDEPVMRDVLSRFRRRSGYEVTESGTVVDALDELMSAARANTPYDHAIVDLILRDGDGEDVLRVVARRILELHKQPEYCGFLRMVVAFLGLQRSLLRSWSPKLRGWCNISPI
jgi:DNA-binding NarL/FixJ family response regulator